MTRPGCACSGPSWQEPYGYRCEACEAADEQCPECEGEALGGSCSTCCPVDDPPSAAQIVRELTRVKVLFQARTIAAIMGFPHAAD